MVWGGGIDSTDLDLNDYKFFCFNGTTKCFTIDFDRFSNHRANYYDAEGCILPFGKTNCPPDYEKQIEIPEELQEMVFYSEKLSSGIPFVRVDFYNVEGKIYFGELTFYPGSGFSKFTSDLWDEKLGNWISIP